MANFEVNKVEDKYRYEINHPDFKDVYETTYAKGVITDFKKISDDPLVVESMVKVTIGGEESGYIPLFYHPKAQYWDNDQILATDYDEINQSFKQAWMSFRCGDEVIVMLNKEFPVAVLGFADGVPRIGENVFKLTCPVARYLFDDHVISSPSDINDHSIHVPSGGDEHFVFFRIHPIDGHIPYPFIYPYAARDEEKNGPDGLDLNLLTGVSPSIIEIVRWFSTPTPYGSTDIEGLYSVIMVPIGPILYVIQSIKFDTIVNHHSVFSNEYFYETQDMVEHRQPYDAEIRIDAALNTPENIKKVVSSHRTMQSRFMGPHLDDYDGFTPQTDLTLDFIAAVSELKTPMVVGTNPYYEPWSAAPMTIYLPRDFDLTKAVFNVRPHTKEELIAANQWPREI